MAEKGREVKHKLIIVHLRCVARQPADFVMNVRMMREKNPQIVLYSDTDTKLKDQALMALKDAWLKAGVKHFFDVRTANQPFSEFIKSLIA